MSLFKRRELEELERWKDSTNRKPLIIRGARQVGKSTLVKLFAETAGLELVEVNLERNPELAEAFRSFDPKKILQNLEFGLKNKKIVPSSSLLFIDEIQQSPDAIQSLRYLFEEMPELHVMAAGSLPELLLADADFSMPVGRVQYMHLGPLQFSDFLFALGENNIGDYLVSTPYAEILEMSDMLHTKLVEYLQLYILVGGMPESVKVFSQERDFQDVSDTHQSILASYRDDFGKYRTRIDTDKIRLVFDRIPRLVGDQIRYSHISKDHKASQLAEALEKLTQARVVHRVKRTAANGLPLDAESSEKKYKTVFVDVGLVSSKLNVQRNSLDVSDITLVNKGAIAEQFVGQHLAYKARGVYEPSLHYWARGSQGSSAELDYVVSQGNNIVPVEVKAGSTGSLKSLHYFMARKKSLLGIRFNTQKPSFLSAKTVETTGLEFQCNLLSLPLYFVDQTERLLDETFAEI